MSAKTCRQCGAPLLLDPKDNSLCGECYSLQQNPDPTSKRTNLGKVPFKDMKHLDEDDRVAELVKMLNEKPTIVIGYMTDFGGIHQGKGDRIIEKVRAKLPDVKIVSRRPGPIADTETISFRRT